MVFFIDDVAIDFLPFEGFSEKTAGFFVERKVGFLVGGPQNFRVDSLVITQPAESDHEEEARPMSQDTRDALDILRGAR